jgi:hypothetical protein
MRYGEREGKDSRGHIIFKRDGVGGEDGIDSRDVI